MHRPADQEQLGVQRGVSGEAGEPSDHLITASSPEPGLQQQITGGVSKTTRQSYITSIRNSAELKTLFRTQTRVI